MASMQMTKFGAKVAIKPKSFEQKMLGYGMLMHSGRVSHFL